MVNSALADQIERVVGEAHGRYYRLVLVAGPMASGKTPAIREVAERHGWPLVNVNRELSERMLELTPKQRALRVADLLRDLVDGAAGEVVLLDNIEVLFHPELAQDPLRLLQNLARNRTVVATWLGTSDEPYLTYAEQGHAEYRRYERPDAAVIPTRSAKG